MTRDRRNRRAAEARYVRFHDEEGRQRPFVQLAEDAYTRLARADAWTTEETIDLQSPQTTIERRGLFRRPREVARLSVATTVTLVLAEAHRVAETVPAAMSAADGCDAGRQVAALVGEVLGELVASLAVMPVAAQRGHAAYRQTMRLTAELTALAQVTEQLGCADPHGCVELLRPEPGGRRQEDVEVTEVRSVLLQRTKAAARQQTDRP